MRSSVREGIMQSERLVYVPGDDGSGLYGQKVKLECGVKSNNITTNVSIYYLIVTVLKVCY